MYKVLLIDPATKTIERVTLPVGYFNDIRDLIKPGCKFSIYSLNDAHGNALFVENDALGPTSEHSFKLRGSDITFYGRAVVAGLTRSDDLKDTNIKLYMMEEAVLWNK